MNTRYDVNGDLYLTDMAGSGLMAKYGDGRVAIATSQVIEDAVGGTVVIGDNATGKEDKFNKGVASLDGNIRVPTAQLENVGGTTAVTNLGSTKEDKSSKGVINGYASLDGTAQVPSNQLGNVARATAKGTFLVGNGSTPTAQAAGATHQALIADTTTGTNTHAQIDAFVSSKGQPNGLATLDSNGRVPLAQLANLSASYPQPVFAGFSGAITTNGSTGNTFIQAPGDGGTSGDLSFINFDFVSIGVNSVSVPRPQAPTSAVTFDAVNSKCTVNVAGEYLHTINVNTTGPGGTARWGVTLYCDDKIVSAFNKIVYAADDGMGDRISFSATVPVNAGNVFDVRLRLSNNNTNLNIIGCSWFCTQLSG
ncbi:uncharacterized protein ACA1_304340 [Acanthamoeba castellanii str. Neff]|uniref:Uncharacterized protein n=1 Tax=Acanthamoeba castellanii (strain ATCC 30010 / Neff) TaxID=1257118 RepID=L8GVL5_ACACF|nr:uncharacterized protein ACA1_304340 [Acanthamoeba castellanii str. Neff]ELR16992.1 hypothetical protein ACA1_304340 [Acanthamoeba castellanii str. Neff]